jgi:hypothetical protein
MKEITVSDLLLCVIVIQLFGVMVRLSTLIRTIRGERDRLSKSA